MLGIDTGGTYTDAVVYDEAADRIVATAKSPTTHDDLAVGVAGAIDAVLANAAEVGSPVDPAELALVSMSTTLATNALVEDKGRSAAIVLVGFDDRSLDRAGLREALGADDRAIVVAGGHTSMGTERVPLDEDALRAAIAELPPSVLAVAITAEFSVRNPAHEEAARVIVAEMCDLPITLSHRLSSRLNGPKRALTAFLNARLVALTAELVDTTERLMVERGIVAPLTVVRGDGTLVAADFVRDRPVETILSGPAASVVGARHLVQLDDAVISDMGGTTTDIAVIRGGHPVVSDAGATVGGHQTMVTAVDMRTHGLGGDSHVDLPADAVGPAITLGPRRVIPVSHLAVEEPGLVHRALDAQLADEVSRSSDGMFVLPARRPDGYEPDRNEIAVFEALADGPAPLGAVASTAVRTRVLQRLAGRGLIRIAGFTPTDAAHTLGLQATHDADAAAKAAALFARRYDAKGVPIAEDGVAFARIVVDRVVRRSGELVLGAVFEHDGLPAAEVDRPVVQAALDRRTGAAALQLRVERPIIGLGAPASTYYPAVGDLLAAEVVVPIEAGVANAVGAVVGRVRIVAEVTVGSPERNVFVVHADGGSTFGDLEAARIAAREAASAALDADMARAGADTFEVEEAWDVTSATIEGAEVVVEATMRLIGTGRPRLAGG